MRQTLQDQRGLGLVEVLIAVMVIVIAGVGMAVMFGEGSAFVEAEGDNRTTLALAKGEIERLRALGYTGLTGVGISSGTRVPPALAQYAITWETRCVNPDNYDTQFENCPPLPAGTPYAKKIIVTVTNASSRKAWQGGVTVASVLAQR